MRKFQKFAPSILMLLLVIGSGCAKKNENKAPDNGKSRLSNSDTLGDLEIKLSDNYLDVIEQEIKSSSGQKSLNTEKEKVENKIIEIQNSAKELEDSITETQSQITEISNKIDKTTQEINSLKQQKKLTIHDMHQFNSKGLEKRNTPSIEAIRTSKNISQLENSIKSLKKEINSQKRAQKYEVENLEQLEASEKSLSLVHSFFESLPLLGRKYAELQAQSFERIKAFSLKISTIKTELDAQESKLADLKLKEQELINTQTSSVSEAWEKFTNQKDEISQKIEKLETELSNLNESLKVKKDELANTQKEFSEKNALIVKYQSEIKALINSSENATSPAPESATAYKLEVLKAIANRESLSPEILSKALIAQHNENDSKSKLSNTEMTDEFLTLAVNAKSNDIEEFKVNYEALLEDHHQGEPLVYNKDFFRMTDLYNSNKVQCYSGTMMFNVLNELTKDPYKHTVVIFTKGHVLAGYIKVENDKKILIGIESTATGKALVNYGETKDIAGEIRVLDAKQFMLIELVKDHISDFEGLYSQMLKTMSDRYGCKTENFMPLDRKEKSPSDAKVLNSTPLGFGKSEVESGDKKRENVSKMNHFEFKASTIESTYPETVDTHQLPKCDDVVFKVGEIYLSKGLDELEFCKNDGKVIKTSNYKAKNVSHSATITYLKDGEEKVHTEYLVDSSRIHNACSIQKSVEGDSLHLSLSNAPDEEFGELSNLKHVLFHAYDEDIISNVANKKDATNISLKSAYITADLMGTNFKAPEKGCSISLKTSPLLKVWPSNPMEPNYFTQEVEGYEVSINCPQMVSSFSESDSQINDEGILMANSQINDVEIKMNCSILTTTYTY